MKRLQLSRLITPAMLKSARAAATYFSTSLVNGILPLALLPILTAKLTPADFGLVALFQSLQSFANVLIYFGLGGTLMRALTVGPEEDRPSYVGSALVIVLGCFGIIAAIGLAGGLLLGGLEGLSVLWLVAAIAAGGFMAINQLNLVVLQAQVRATRFAAMQIGMALLNAALTLLLVVAFNGGWEGRALAILIPYVVFSAIGMGAMVWEGQIGRPRIDLIKDAAQLSGATMPHVILNNIMTVGDRILLSFFFSSSVVGIYAVGLQLAQGIMLIGSSLHGALQPVGLKMLAKMQDWKARKQLGLIALALSLLILVSSLVYMFAIMFLKAYIVDEEFWGFVPYFYVLSIASIAQSIYFLFSYPLFYYRAMRVLATTGVVLFVIFAVASLGGIFLLGPIGVSFGIVSARLALLGVAIFYSARLTANHLRTISGAGSI